MVKSLDALFTKLTPGYLALWAGYVLRTHRPIIVGVTGSVGKTTTKEVVAAALMQPQATALVGRVRKSSGNMNNNVGLPLTVLGYDRWPRTLGGWLTVIAAVPLRALRLARSADYPDVLVLEYAAGWDGDVPHLARLAPPTVAVVTAIGPSHLERFGTVEGVARHKVALVEAVPPSGLVVLGLDNPYRDAMAAASAAPVQLVPGKGRDLSVSVARVVAQFFGAPDGVVDCALQTALRTAGRFDAIELGTVTVIDDSFNANPLSMKFALDSFGTVAARGRRRVAILGTMAELGEASREYHEEIASYLRGRTDVVIGVGALAKHYQPHHWYPDADSCAHQLSLIIRGGAAVLVKGSHSVHLHRVVKRLRRLVEEHAIREAVA